MIKNENIVCISNTTWEGFYTKSTVQIMSLIAKNNTILFVEYPFTIKDLIFGLFGINNVPVYRILGIKKRIVVKSTSFSSTLFNLVIPPVLSIEFIKIECIHRFLLKLNIRIYQLCVKKTLTKLNMKNPIIINAYNAIYGEHLIGKFQEKLHVFYCYDGPDVKRYGQRAILADENFSKKVDGVIVTSDFLYNQKKEQNQNISVVKNGVDFKTFNTMAKTEVSLIFTRKKIGYVGSLDHRFDIDTVEYAIQNMPENDFEFVGELMNKTVENRLAKYSNVKFKQPVPPNEVPGIMRNFDVGLIPYTITDYNKNIYPLKINEYLSVGIPVVLTTFAELPDFKEVVTFASNKESFYSAIKNEIEHDNNTMIKKRIEFAKMNSWENRAKQFGNILEELTSGKNKKY